MSSQKRSSVLLQTIGFIYPQLSGYLEKYITRILWKCLERLMDCLAKKKIQNLHGHRLHTEMLDRQKDVLWLVCPPTL